MSRQMWGAVIGLTAFLVSAAPANAASIALFPGGALTGLPGETIGWGYEIFTDPGFFIDGTTWVVTVDVLSDPSGGTTADLFPLFDYPDVPANTHLIVPYDPLQLPFPTGFFTVTLSPLLAPGQTVTGRVYGSFTVLPVGGGIAAADVQEFDLAFAATAVGTAAVPESSTLFLLGLGLVAAGYRLRKNHRSLAVPPV